MSDAAEVWAGLGPVWQAVFDEAWTSWQAGNFGVGAVLVDPNSGAVVATGRNRVAEVPSTPGVVAGNMLAHAEINAFAAMGSFNAAGLHLYSTLEPCLMCAGTAMQLKVERVHFAAFDEFYDGMADLWAAHPLTAARHPVQVGPFVGERAPLAAFARVLPLTFTARHFPTNTAAELARRRHPQLWSLAEHLVAHPVDRGVVDAVAELWDRLG
ncbi:MAG: deaminase [Actinomycetota bacterium]